MRPQILTQRAMTVAGRCDRCGAAAKARVVLPSGGELLFCGHHAQVHAKKLRELEIDILPILKRAEEVGRTWG